jgi:hypothetical protein
MHEIVYIAVFGAIIAAVMFLPRPAVSWRWPASGHTPSEHAGPSPERVRKLAIGVRTWLPTDEAETFDDMCRALGFDVPPVPRKRLLPPNPVRQDDED